MEKCNMEKLWKNAMSQPVYVIKPQISISFNIFHGCNCKTLTAILPTDVLHFSMFFHVFQLGTGNGNKLWYYVMGLGVLHLQTEKYEM
jgi:hypothetical protein